MGLKEDLAADVRDIFATRWNTRKGYVVPEAEDVGLDNDAVKLEEAAVLYADLAESTALAGISGASPWLAVPLPAWHHRATSTLCRRRRVCPVA